MWLNAPSRFAGVSKTRALWIAAVLFLLLALGVSAAPPAPPGDPTTYDGVIDGVRAGGDYYALTAQALRAEGDPLKPFYVFRLPTHAVVQAALPASVAIALFGLLALGVGVAWWNRLRTILIRPSARVSAVILLAAGLVASVGTDAIGAHQVWAALLVPLALAIRTPRRWTESVALGMIAMLVDETAAVFGVVMAVCAWREGAVREGAGWGLALLGFVLVLTAHAWGVSHVVGPLDPEPDWPAPGGLGGVLHALAAATALRMLSMPLALPLLVLAVFGWSAWRDPLAGRVLLSVVGYAAALVLLAGGDGLAWAVPLAPVLLVGLVFAPDGMRDLAAALLDRRRVRVQRISQ